MAAQEEPESWFPECAFTLSQLTGPAENHPQSLTGLQPMLVNIFRKNIPMTKYLIVFLLALTVNDAKASCLACWEQRKVEIVLTTGDTLTGYVEWNELWISTIPELEKWKDKFPESLVPFYRNAPCKKQLVLIKEFIDVKNDSIDAFFCTKNELKQLLDYNQILSVKELDISKKKREGADDVLILTQPEIDKLRTNPVAVIVIEEPVSDTCFLSYNPLITKQILRSITPENYRDKIPELKMKGVIVYSISYD
jgi:hypothetical protein